MGVRELGAEICSPCDKHCPAGLRYTRELLDCALGDSELVCTNQHPDLDARDHAVALLAEDRPAFHRAPGKLRHGRRPLAPKAPVYPFIESQSRSPAESGAIRSSYGPSGLTPRPGVAGPR